MRRRLVAVVLLAGACGGSQARPDHGVADNSDDPRAAAASEDGRLLAGEEKAATRPARVPGAGALTRQSLDETLAAGPGAFLGTIRVRAIGDKGVFKGWIIVSLWPGAHTELVPGDVVKRLNGRTLEKPDDVSDLWESLRTAREIVVDYERAGEPRVYRVPVVE